MSAGPPLKLRRMHLAGAVCIDCEATIEEASRLMREQQVDALVVIDTLDGSPIPAGIVSAHDIVTRVVAVGLEPAVVTAGDILWTAAPQA